MQILTALIILTAAEALRFREDVPAVPAAIAAPAEELPNEVAVPVDQDVPQSAMGMHTPFYSQGCKVWTRGNARMEFIYLQAVQMHLLTNDKALQRYSFHLAFSLPSGGCHGTDVAVSECALHFCRLGEGGGQGRGVRPGLAGQLADFAATAAPTTAAAAAETQD